ncbi:hypothetical protein MTO98_30505 [Mucilaginibacter sp. SMC90]|jgi:lipopolysaccharide export LptBFGC system permease protein LptF|uniref:hypothetical protein n=1 Tax=Mucilaginibacter sp. SMC90 TaxID=2929803 RepID=UPI001FB1DFCF|nr:hypothetical protein [Mucilaginibacter sp. SMC90]UOE48734.1 hypothetical protein MTO98_30505 [Mucilaginibacter sp. SMC90]
MIVEELIYFEKQQLKPADPLDVQVSKIQAFFSAFPPVSLEKLKFFVVLLKERQAEEQRYQGFSLYKLISVFLVVSAIISALAFRGGSPFQEIRMGLLMGSMILAVLWIFLLMQLIHSKKNLKYQLLIRVLESHIEKISMG